MSYKTVSIFSSRKIDYLALTPDKLKAIEQEVVAVNLHNKTEYVDLTREWNRMLEFVQSVWGKNSAAFKYWQSHKIPKPPDLATSFSELSKKAVNSQRKKRQLEAQAQAEAYERQRRNDKARATRAQNKALAEERRQWELDIQAD